MMLAKTYGNESLIFKDDATEFSFSLLGLRKPADEASTLFSSTDTHYI